MVFLIQSSFFTFTLFTTLPLDWLHIEGLGKTGLKRVYWYCRALSCLWLRCHPRAPVGISLSHHSSGTPEKGATDYLNSLRGSFSMQPLWWEVLMSPGGTLSLYWAQTSTGNSVDGLDSKQVYVLLTHLMLLFPMLCLREMMFSC